MADSTETIEGLRPLPEFGDEWEKGVPYVFRGLPIIIEYLAGDERTKVKDSGVVVTNIMPTAYGYILRTTDIHGEEIDMYLATLPDPNTPVFVIDQIHPGSNVFDEHKVMLGFGSVEEVIQNYFEVFSDGSGPDRLGAITAFVGETFLEWTQLDGSSLQPAGRYEVPGVTTVSFKGVLSPPRQNKSDPVPIDEAGGVVINLPDVSQGPKLCTSSSELGVFNYTLYLYSALDIKEWTTTVDTLCRTLSLAGEKDTVHIHIVSPGGSVVLMARIISAIRSTKAKVITYAEGIVASAATTIWGAGHERHILPGAYFMQHMSSQLLEGKTSDIVAKAKFCMDYIIEQLEYLQSIGLFSEDEILEMIDKSSDVFVSGNTAIARMGSISYRETQEEDHA